MSALISEQKVFRLTFALIVFALLLLSSLWIISPFLPAMVWSVMIVVASWPLMLEAQARLYGRRSFAVIAMTIAMLLVLILPLSLALMAVVNHAGEISHFIKSIIENGIPKAPDWIADIPLLGKNLENFWSKTARIGHEEIITKLTPYISIGFGWFASKLGNVGLLFIHFLLTVILAAILYSKGESVAAGSLRFARRFAGEQGENALILAAQAVRAVALGVVVTALMQTVLAALGFLVVGVPYASILACIVFFLSVIQVGAGPILILAIIWAYTNVSTFAATAFLLWSILIMLADNFVRPLLIRAGADIPLLIIFAGVVGGLLSMGIVGLFLGPVLLAVTYTLLRAWVNSAELPESASH